MNTASQSIARAIEATHQLCSLPAIPTQDWASSVADALTNLAPSLIIGVLIAHLDQQKDSINPISTGVSHMHWDQLLGEAQGANKALYIQDKLDRISSLGFQLPENTLSRGLVAPISMLHPRWSSTPLGRIFTSQQLTSPILAIIPITIKHPGFVLIITLAFDQDSARSTQSTQALDSTDRTIEILSELLPLISVKANLALEQVSNPKAWLTDREHEILDQLIIGHSVRVIAGNLGRSAHTVHDHVKNLHKKLGASSRGELIAKALGYRPDSPSIYNNRLAADPIVLTGNSQIAELKPLHATARHARPL